MLRTRIITAVILAPLVIAAVIWIPTVRVHWLFAFIGALVGWEWAQFGHVRSSPLRFVYGLIPLAVVGFVIGRVPAEGINNALLVFSPFWLIAFGWLFRPELGQPDTTANNAIKLILGQAIIVSSMAALSLTIRAPDGLLLILCLMLIIWAADVGAFFTGKALGRHKLAPRVSPGKTWEGAAGGWVCGLVTGCVFTLWLPLSIQKMVVIATVTVATSIVGDLLASLLKRHVGLKDSGVLLPGHGGFVDRLDSLLAAAPVFYCLYVTL